jgi:glycosyltransferase involved in cell wall biosynthesis
VVNLQFQTAAFDMSATVHFLPQMIHIPLVTTFHDLRFPYLFPKAGKLRNWIVQHLARRSDGVIATNHEDGEQLAYLQHNTVIPIGSNIMSDLPTNYDRDTWRAKVGAEADTFLIGHFGFIKEVKGVDDLLDAVSRLRDDHMRIRIVFIGGRSNTVDAGSDDPYLAQLDAKIQQLGLGEYIHWTGFVEEADVAQYLSAVDLVALPFRDGASYRRGSLMAAIQYGCSILTTEPSIPTSAFQHQANVWLVPPHSAEQIEQSIRHLHANPTQLTTLRNGALSLRQLFDWDTIAHQTVDFYQTILDNR